MSARGSITSPSLGAATGFLLTALGLAIGLRSLADNSFLTHLATGRLILERGSVPSTDPYTFTAAGEPWVVQSWLASVLYALVERLGGLEAVRLLMGVVAAGVVGLGWRLLRPARGLVGRLGLGALLVAVGSGLWTERPYMLGLLAFALFVLAIEGGLHPAWLLPIAWAWVNTHGSFPLGIVFLVVATLGTRLDGGDASLGLRCLRWAVGGTLAGAVGPLGPKVLLFPLDLLQRQELLANVVEWQAPAFTSLSQRAFLVQAMVAVVLLVRRPSYRSGLVLVVFMAAALLGSRNIVVASIALLPGMAISMGALGSLRSESRTASARVLAALAVAAMVGVTAVRLSLPSLDLDRYPVDLVAYLEGRSIDTREVRLAAPDFAGNFLSFVYGAQGRVFYDDRFDMFPSEASEAALDLSLVRPGVFASLESYRVDLVAVTRSSPMTLVLSGVPEWRSLYQDEQWVLSCRRGVDLGGDLGAC